MTTAMKQITTSLLAAILCSLATAATENEIKNEISAEVIVPCAEAFVEGKDDGISDAVWEYIKRNSEAMADTLDSVYDVVQHTENKDVRRSGLAVWRNACIAEMK